MPVNRNALIRYKTIDKCLQNRYRQWTLEDLIEACSEALYEYEGIMKGISRRTVQLDIQMMRSDKLGYNAPIIVYDNKYYTYEDPDYSITNIPLTDKDLGKLSEAVEFMRQFKGFSHFRELDGMVQKLEDHIYSQKKNQKPAIDFEKNENLKGLEFLEVLYQSIIQQHAITLTYQSFKARQATTFYFHPCLLKEFRNRWFIIGTRKKDEPLLTLALDRIIDIHPANVPYIGREDFKAEEYFKDVIGVSVSPDNEPEKVVLFVTHQHAQYILTKPLHSSQKVIEKDEHGITIELKVQHNFELEKEILGMGEGMIVLAPERLKRNITGRLHETIDLYQGSLKEKGVVTIQRKLEHKGFAEVKNLYTRRVVHHIGMMLSKSGVTGEEEQMVKSMDTGDIPKLRSLLVNRNIEKIARQVDEHIGLKEVIFHQGMPLEYLDWSQSGYDAEFSVIFFLEHRRIPSFTLFTLPGTHKKKLNKREQSLIIQNAVPAESVMVPGSALLIKPLLMRRFDEGMRDRKVRFFELRFG